jgi:hypothetical protein
MSIKKKKVLKLNVSLFIDFAVINKQKPFITTGAFVIFAVVT